MVTNSAKKLKKVLIWYWSDNDYNCTGTVYVAFHCKLQTHIISSSCHNGKLNHAYHAIGGISLGMFFVLHGASKLPAQFLPKIPPRMVKGKPTKTEKTKQNNTFQCMHEYIFIFQNNSLISVTDGSQPEFSKLSWSMRDSTTFFIL